MKTIGRRKFAQIISSAGIAGTALMEAMYAEVQDSGSLSRGSVQAFVDLSGMRFNDSQVVTLQASLERALEAMKRVRDRSVRENVAPVVIFRVRG